MEKEALKNIFSNKYDMLCFYIFITIVIVIIEKGLLVGLLASVIAFELSGMLASHINHKKSKSLAIILIGVATISLITAFFWGIITYLRGGDKIANIMNRMANLLVETKNSNLIPHFLDKYVPDNMSELNILAVNWLQGNSERMVLVGESSVKVFVYLVLGVIIGLMVSAYINIHNQNITNLPTTDLTKSRPIYEWFFYHVSSFKYAMRSVVFAQVKISAINTFLTWIYLCLLLPYVFDVKLPFVYSMVVVTFLVGLIPVVGNLISNTMIVVISLSSSLYTALGSLMYLVIIHKLEYFINAKIIGDKINARPYELLIAMLLFERIFGIQGVVLAPICWAYIKSEMFKRKLI